MAKAKQSIEELQNELSDAREKLASLRADREARAREAVEDVQRAQLKAELENLRREIDAEQGLLAQQEEQNPEAIATGFAPETAPDMTAVTGHESESEPETKTEKGDK